MNCRGDPLNSLCRIRRGMPTLLAWLVLAAIIPVATGCTDVSLSGSKTGQPELDDGGNWPLVFVTPMTILDRFDRIEIVQGSVEPRFIADPVPQDLWDKIVVRARDGSVVGLLSVGVTAFACPACELVNLAVIPAGAAVGAIKGATETTHPDQQRANAQTAARELAPEKVKALHANELMFRAMLQHLHEHPPRIEIGNGGDASHQVSVGSRTRRNGQIRKRTAILELQVREIVFRLQLFSSMDAPAYGLNLQGTAILRNARTGAQIADRDYYWSGRPRPLREWLDDNAAAFREELDGAIGDVVERAADDFLHAFEFKLLPDKTEMPYAAISMFGAVGLAIEQPRFCWRFEHVRLPPEIVGNSENASLEQLSYRFRVRELGETGTFLDLIAKRPNGRVIYEGSGTTERCHRIKIDPVAMGLTEHSIFDRQWGVFQWDVDTWVRVNGRFDVHLLSAARSLAGSKVYFYHRSQ